MRAQEKLEATFFSEKNATQHSSIVGSMTCPWCGTKELPILNNDPHSTSKDSYFLGRHLGCGKRKVFFGDFFKIGDSLELSSGKNVQEGKFTVYGVVYHAGIYQHVKVIQDGESQLLIFRYRAERRKWVRLSTFQDGKSCLLKKRRRLLYEIKKL